MTELVNTSDLRALVRQQRQQGNVNGAAETLRGAIEGIGLELADLYGMLGGTMREKGDLVASAAGYDSGFELDRRFGPASSYNELNRLIARVELVPACLDDPDALRGHRSLPFVDVIEELKIVEDKLRRDVDGPRSNDPWAAGDLALAAALVGHTTDALAAVDHLKSLAPDPSAHARAAYATTLAALASLDTRQKHLLVELRTRLEQG
jgi:hypothetical protein